jgi:hypothetical protein
MTATGRHQRAVVRTSPIRAVTPRFVLGAGALASGIETPPVQL